MHLFQSRYGVSTYDSDKQNSDSASEKGQQRNELNFPEEWMANIHDSMFHFTKNKNSSISSLGLNKAYESLRHGLFIRVENNSVYAKSKTVYKTPWESSFKNGVPDKFFCRMYYVLCSLDSDTNIDIIYSHADEPVGHVNSPYPAFSWVKSEFSTDLLVPYGEAWGGALRSKNDNCDPNLDDNLWNKKLDKGVWRGANTGVRSDGDWKGSPRAQLVMICNKFPDLCDAGFTQFVNGKMDQIQDMKNSLGIVDTLSKREQDKFKYAIVPDGNSAPSSRMKSHIESSSLIMKQNSIFKEFFYDSLQPFVHYLPLRSDFQDLAEKIEWAKNNDVLAHSMMLRARNFACKWFTNETIHSYVLNVFKEYVKHFKDIKATNIRTSDMVRVKINSVKDLEQTCGISRERFSDNSCKILT